MQLPLTKARRVNAGDPRLDGPPCGNQKTLIKTIKRLKASQPDIEAGKLVRVLSQFARELK